MAKSVAQVNINTLPAAEAAAIREAEAQAEAFYQTIENEENEQTRIIELQAACAILLKTKGMDTEAITARLDRTGLFTDNEKATVILAADNYNNADLATTLRTFDLLRSANSIYRTVKAGGYPDVTVTNLLSRIKPAPTQNKFC